MKILLIQLRRVGDILLTTPSLKFLKKALPNSEIDFLSEPMGRSVLETNPYISNLHLYDKNHGFREILRLRSQIYDTVIDMMGNPRTAILTALSRAKWKVGFRYQGRSIFYNCKVPVPKKPEYVAKRKWNLIEAWLRTANLPNPNPVNFRPELFLSKEDEEFATEWLKNENLLRKGFVILVPAHRHPIRRWRGDGFRDLALKIRQGKGIKVFLAWGPGEERLMEEIRKGHENEIGLLPPTTLRQMGAIFKQAKLIVTNDSGAMHVAVSVETPTVTIYGPTRPIDWNPFFLENENKKDVAITAQDVPCLGCHLKECPSGHICMKNISVEEVLRVSSRFL